MKRTFRVVWGLLFLAALAWLCYGITATSSAVNQVAGGSASSATQAGAALGGGIALTTFLCTGGLPALVFGFLYWRNGVAMREEKRHAEMLDVLSRKTKNDSQTDAL